MIFSSNESIVLYLESAEKTQQTKTHSALESKPSESQESIEENNNGRGRNRVSVSESHRT